MTDLRNGNNCIEASSEKYCTGCGACIAACPFKAIHLSLDNAGFLTPAVNKDLCRNCGACKTSCYRHANDAESPSLDCGRVLAAWSTSDAVRRVSSSGGVAYEIAVWAIRHEYEVWGVAYDYHQNKAYHISAHSIDELKAFQGSKYIQSDTSVLMDAIRSDQISRKAVIFGTPCQIYALRKLKGNRDWILIEIFCSGVPSYFVWKKYINYISSKYHIDKPAEISFRDKSRPWHDYYISIQGQNGNRYANQANDDIFYGFFLSKKAFRDSCFDCRLKMAATYADIRLGDFWGKRYCSNDSGVSQVIINNQTGKEIVDDLIAEHSIAVEDANFEEVKEAQHIINQKRTQDVDKIRRAIAKKPIQFVYWRYLARPLPKVVARKIYHSLPAPAYGFLKKMRGYR